MSIWFEFAEGLMAVLGLLGLAGTLYAAVRWGLFRAQQTAIKTLEEGLRVETDRGDRLERQLKEMETELQLLRAEVSRKEGVIQGKDDAMRHVIAAVADSAGCAIARDCPNRVIPGEEGQ